MIKKNKTNIAIAGYGHLGSKLVAWLKRHGQGTNILYVVEPDNKKHQILIKDGLKTYRTINSVPKELILNTRVIVDCSTKGQGAINKISYKKLGLSAIFQNGEDIKIGHLYYPGISSSQETHPYVRIPCCSAMSVLRILLAMKKAKLPTPTKVIGYHNKTSNDSRMITINYVSGKEVQKLTNIKTTMNRIYLRGVPYNHEYVYAGNIDIRLAHKPNITKAMNALAAGQDISMVDQNIDTTDFSRTSNTLIIKESILADHNILHIAFLSLPPEIDFPANLSAIKYMSKSKL